MDDVFTSLASSGNRDTSHMTIKNQKKWLVVILFGLLTLSGCALREAFLHLTSLPTTTAISSPEPSFTVTFTSEPSVTQTITPTITPISTPTITPTPTSTTCLEDGGTVQRLLVPSTALPDGLPISIYLPPCYDPSGSYPVLYLLHGQVMTDDYWIDLGAVSIADAAIRNGQTPFMMVFPFEERNLDDNSTSMFPDAMVNDLIPWVDANFATCAEKICRAIGGISRGGGWAIKLSMRNLDLFGSMGAHSFGLMIGDAGWVQKQLVTRTVEDFPRIYMDRGEKDFLAEDIDYFVKVLEANGIRHEFHIYPGDHTKSYWQDHLQEYMNFYMAAWPSDFKQP